MTGQLLAEAERLLPELVALHLRLHQEQKIGLYLPRTQELVLAAFTD